MPLGEVAGNEPVLPFSWNGVSRDLSGYWTHKAVHANHQDPLIAPERVAGRLRSTKGLI
jgi:hypothetical protein